jgi:hypothetical protein
MRPGPPSIGWCVLRRPNGSPTTRRRRAPNGMERARRAQSLAGIRDDAPGRAGAYLRRSLAGVRAQPHRRDQRGLRQNCIDSNRASKCSISFATSVREALATLRSLDDDAWEKVGWSPEGERPYHRFQETRVLDSWIHLQDIRDALLEPADDHGVAEEIVVNRFEAALPFVIGKKMKAPEGTIIHLNLTGRLARTIFLEVRDGSRRGVHVTAKGFPTLEFTTPIALFWRRTAGRISAQAFLSASASDVRGDHALGGAFRRGAHHHALERLRNEPLGWRLLCAPLPRT